MYYTIVPLVLQYNKHDGTPMYIYGGGPLYIYIPGGGGPPFYIYGGGPPLYIYIPGGSPSLYIGMRPHTRARVVVWRRWCPLFSCFTELPHRHFTCQLPFVHFQIRSRAMLRLQIDMSPLCLNMNPRARARDWVKEGGAGRPSAVRPHDLHIATSTYTYTPGTARCLQRPNTPLLGVLGRVTAVIYVY